MDSTIFITPEAVAELLGTSLAWVYAKSRSRQRNPLPVLRIGRYLRFERDSVIAWARSCGNAAANKVTKREQKKAGVQ
jgi:predicted DNA-binding transcriptional regulator AlpA